MNVQLYNNVLASLSITRDKRFLTGMNIIFDLSGVLFNPLITENRAPKGAVLAIKPIYFSKTVRLLQDCVEQGHYLFVISNWTEQWYDFLLADPQIASMFKLFDDIILADKVGIKKPDPRIFGHLIEKHKLDPCRCIFIDDQQVNLKAAQQVGISKGILCRNLNLYQVRQDLQFHGAL